MLKKIFVSLAILASVLLTGCTESVPAGYVGVVEKHPYFMKGGVDEEVLVGGDRYFIAWTSSLYLYDIKPVQQEEAFNDLATIKSTPVDFKAIVRYEIIPEQAPVYHAKFGENMYAINLKKDFQNMLRDFVRLHTVQELTTNPVITSDGEDAVYEKMVAIVKAKGIPIRVLAVTIGAIIPPEDVLAESARTEAQLQRGLTEDSRADTEKKRKQAEKNKAEADKAYMNEMNMTPDEYLKGREIEIQKEIVEVVKKKDNVNMLVVVGGALPKGVTVPQPVVEPKK